MFLWWSDPYTWITVAVTLLTVTLVARLMFVSLKGSQKRWITGVVAMFWMLSFCPWLYITAKARDLAGEQQHTPAPNVTITLENGRHIFLADLRGRVVVLEFWATWCAPCRASEPAVNRLLETNRGKGLVLARISGDQNVDKWRHYLTAHPTRALEGLDEGAIAATAFGVQGRPTFVIVDEQGVIRWKQSGWNPYSYFFLRRALVAVLG